MSEPLKKIPAYSYTDIMAHSRFRDAVLVNNRRLVTIYRHLPRYASSVADMRRWVMMHGMLSLHFAHRLNPSHPPLTISQLCKVTAKSNLVTYSTATNFLKTLEKSGYVRPLSGLDARTRTLRLSAFSERMACLYTDINLRALDVLDNGGRHIVAENAPSLLISMQPPSSQAMMNAPSFFDPPSSIGTLTPSTTGILLLNELTRSAPGPSENMPPRISIRLDSIQVISFRYQISEHNLVRLLDVLRQNGHYGDDTNGHWISGRLLKDYYEWQATKLACISSAFIPAYTTVFPAAAHLTR